MSGARTGSVTLIMYTLKNIDEIENSESHHQEHDSMYDRFKSNLEIALNRSVARAQGSDITHVEMAIGDRTGINGELCNVCRVYSGGVVEIEARTGLNPSFSYINMKCTKAQEDAMLRKAYSLKGVPFSWSGMMRSITMFPRTTDETSVFCSELIAILLQAGSLLDRTINPGSVTPEMIYQMFQKKGSTHANPFILNNMCAERDLVFMGSNQRNNHRHCISSENRSSNTPALFRIQNQCTSNQPRNVICATPPPTPRSNSQVSIHPIVYNGVHRGSLKRII